MNKKVKFTIYRVACPNCDFILIAGKQKVNFQMKLLRQGAKNITYS